MKLIILLLAILFASCGNQTTTRAVVGRGFAVPEPTTPDVKWHAHTTTYELSDKLYHATSISANVMADSAFAAGDTVRLDDGVYILDECIGTK